MRILWKCLKEILPIKGSNGLCAEKNEEMIMDTFIKIGNRTIGENHPVYFIADIAANHNGSLEKAKELIGQAKEAGADAVKFQHFRAEAIVSDWGFSHMDGKQSHQAKWDKPVVQVYREASVPWDWTKKLNEYCGQAGVTFFSAPYDLEAVDHLDQYVPAFKVGSGDITWHESLERIASKGKPVLLATGASTLGEVQDAVRVITKINKELILMQCNTNYTGGLENFKYVSLNVLKTYRAIWPEMVLGLSDHTAGHATVLGMVALGGLVVEKHFTDDTNQKGPDHAFSMDPKSWREMVLRSRELEASLGNREKVVEENENETVVVQRRCCRAARPLKRGTVLKRDDIDVLRPAPRDAVSPADVGWLTGSVISRDMEKGEHFTWKGL